MLKNLARACLGLFLLGVGSVQAALVEVIYSGTIRTRTQTMSFMGSEPGVPRFFAMTTRLVFDTTFGLATNNATTRAQAGGSAFGSAGVREASVTFNFDQSLTFDLLNDFAGPHHDAFSVIGATRGLTSGFAPQPFVRLEHDFSMLGSGTDSVSISNALRTLNIVDLVHFPSNLDTLFGGSYSVSPVGLDLAQSFHTFELRQGGGMVRLGANISSVQVSPYTPTAAVPEPSTWAMMLIGFAGLGYAARRRREVSAS